jgi:uncharacterized RDD family membrane protein YckC
LAFAVRLDAIDHAHARAHTPGMSVSPPSSLGSAPPPPFYPEPPRWTAPPLPLRTYAGFWIRFLAWFIDSFVVGFAYGLPMSILFAQHGFDTCPQLVSAGNCASTAGYYLLARTWPDFVLTALYFVLTWWLAGGTLGQHLLGLRVVDATTGARISVLQSIGRFFGYLLSIWVLCLGLIWVGLDTYKQGWHDKLAHTYVLRQYRF